MGITLKSFGTAELDRSAGQLVIETRADDRDQWDIISNWQDAIYEGDERQAEPTRWTDSVSVKYGEIKDLDLPGGSVTIKKVSDLLPLVRGLAYYLRQARDEKIGPFAPPAPPPEDARP